MASDFVVRWDSFEGGNYGILDPSRPAKDQFSGQNILRYNSGLLGVRAGLKQFPVNWSGAPGTHPTLGPLGFDVKDNFLLVTLDKTYRIPFATGVANPYAAYTAPPSQFVRFAQGDRNLYALVNGDLWKHDDLTGAVTQIPLPNSIKLAHLVRWGYYLIGVEVANPYRLWHSTVTIAGPDFDTWGPNSYIDIGGNLPVKTLKPLFNMLYCGKADGWWGLSGILGESAAVRLRNMGNGPIDDRQTAVTTDNRVLYWGGDQTPVWFNGDEAKPEANYQLRGYRTGFAADTIAATATGRRLVMVGEATGQTGPNIRSGMLLNDTNKWSTHTFDIPISAVAGGDVRNMTMVPAGIVFMCQRPTTIGEPVSVVTFEIDGDRPAHIDDQWAAPGDVGGTELVTGTLDLPAHWDGQGRYMKVTGLIVQFRKWPSGIPKSRNELHVQIAPFGLYEGGTMNTEIKVWAESSNRADPLGSDDSKRFSFGENPHSAGFQVRFPRLRGVAIREVIAEVEVRTTRG